MWNSKREHDPAPDHSRQSDLGHNRPVSDKLHPYIYVAIVGLGLLYVVSAWAGFVAEGDIAYLLAVVSVLFFITMAIPCALWLASCAGRDPHAKQHARFRDWVSGNFRTWQGDLKASLRHSRLRAREDFPHSCTSRAPGVADTDLRRSAGVAGIPKPQR
jgi:hypothetical protein